mgnify:CR=1 FL=1
MISNILQLVGDLRLEAEDSALQRDLQSRRLAVVHAEELKVSAEVEDVEFVAEEEEGPAPKGGGTCAVDPELYSILKDLRKKIAKQYDLPPYVIFQDPSLEAMATTYPITMEELKLNHSGIPHGGFVIRSGKTGLNKEHSHIIEYSLKLDSNPEFTGSVLAAYARAVYRLAQRGDFGCKSVFDIAPADLSLQSRDELLAHML